MLMQAFQLQMKHLWHYVTTLLFILPNLSNIICLNINMNLEVTRNVCKFEKNVSKVQTQLVIKWLNYNYSERKALCDNHTHGKFPYIPFA